MCPNQREDHSTPHTIQKRKQAHGIINDLDNVDFLGQPDSDVHKRHKPQKKINVMENIDSVPSTVQSASQEALLYVFEDNEAVIKMMIKGRSLAMRHVSRTHRVAFDSLFDRINLDLQIQRNYMDTKNQLADILTKGISHVMSGIIC